MSSHQQSADPGDPSARVAALRRAATAALRAPSILNTQPWQWRIHGEAAELRADRARQLPVIDPEGRLLTLSCGTALDHLRTALAAEGYQTSVVRMPDQADRDLLARVEITGHKEPDATDMRHYQSMLIRHTDRRPFLPTPMLAATIEALRGAVEQRSAHLHVIRLDQLAEFTVIADRAAAAETADPAYRAELSAWTNRAEGSDEGVPASTAVPEVRRRVPLRDFMLDGTGGLPAGTGDDTGATYGIIFTDADDPDAWLRAGEAFSALLLTAVEHDVSVSPMSDLIEVTSARESLRRLIARIGEPMLVLRMGLAEPIAGIPETPRRSAEEVITGDLDGGDEGTS